MSQAIRLRPPPAPSVLPRLTAHFPDTFLHAHYWAARLPRGSHVFRYGASAPQVLGSRQAWVNFTEDCYAYAEDAIRYCSLLDVTVADHGERDPLRGRPAPGVIAPQSWNTAAVRGDWLVLRDLYVWAGITAPMAFDRLQGVQVTKAGQSPHLVTSGGATQILIRNADLSGMRVDGAIVALPRARLLQ